MEVKHVSHGSDAERLPSRDTEPLDNSAGEQGLVVQLESTDDTDYCSDTASYGGKDELWTFAVLLGEDRDEWSGRASQLAKDLKDVEEKMLLSYAPDRTDNEELIAAQLGNGFQGQIKRLGEGYCLRSEHRSWQDGVDYGVEEDGPEGCLLLPGWPPLY